MNCPRCEHILPDNYSAASCPFCGNDFPKGFPIDQTPVRPTAPSATKEWKGSSTFSVDEIKDLSGIISRLRQQSDGVSALLWKGLSAPDQQILTKYQTAEPTSKQAQDAVLQVLNKIVVGPIIFESERFKGVSLRQETIDLMKQNPGGSNLAHLNRLLLEDTYPLELSSNRKWWLAFWLVFLGSPCVFLCTAGRALHSEGPMVALSSLAVGGIICGWLLSRIFLGRLGAQIRFTLVVWGTYLVLAFLLLVLLGIAMHGVFSGGL